MKITQNHSLSSLHTFGTDIKTAYFVEVRTPNELADTLSLPYQPILILGGGSNILFTRNFPGLVIKNSISGIEILEKKDDVVLVEVGAGENWHRFVIWCLEHDFGGVENLSLIPGTVGAAPIQNIGAYGMELSQVFHSLDAIDRTSGDTQSFTKEACHFGYRNSIFKGVEKGKYIVTKVRFFLSCNEHQLATGYGAIKQYLDDEHISEPTIRDVSNAVISIRRSKLPDPDLLGNAGSFFKNPVVDHQIADRIQMDYPSMPFYKVDEGHVKIPAGWLIEQCGWKGYREGDAGVSENHALVLVNYGNASGRQLKRLAKAIQKSVKDTFKIEIEPEVNII